MTPPYFLTRTPDQNRLTRWFMAKGRDDSARSALRTPDALDEEQGGRLPRAIRSKERVPDPGEAEHQRRVVSARCDAAWPRRLVSARARERVPPLRRLGFVSSVVEDCGRV